MIRWPFRRKPDSPLADGELVTVSGTVRALGPLLEAPLTGTPTVAFASRARIVHQRIQQSYGGKLLTELTDRRVEPFELETAAAVILVDAPAAELAVAEMPMVPRHLDRERAFIAKHGSSSVDLRTVSFVEWCLVPGAIVEVRGLAVEEVERPATERGFRDAPSRFRIVAHANYPVTIRAVW